jgi:hypothetical protein
MATAGEELQEPLRTIESMNLVSAEGPLVHGAALSASSHMRCLLNPKGSSTIHSKFFQIAPVSLLL